MSEFSDASCCSLSVSCALCVFFAMFSDSYLPRSLSTHTSLMVEDAVDSALRNYLYYFSICSNTPTPATQPAGGCTNTSGNVWPAPAFQVIYITRARWHLSRSFTTSYPSLCCFYFFSFRYLTTLAETARGWVSSPTPSSCFWMSRTSPSASS